MRERRCLDAQVDAIEQWSGELRTVALDLLGRAAAAQARVPQVAATTGIHRRDQLKARRESRLARSAGNGDTPRLERLAKGFERVAREFGELVQKQDPMVGKGDFPRPRRVAATDQRAARRGVMRRSKRPLAPGCDIDAQSRNRVHRGSSVGAGP